MPSLINHHKMATEKYHRMESPLQETMMVYRLESDKGRLHTLGRHPVCMKPVVVAEVPVAITTRDTLAHIDLPPVLVQVTAKSQASGRDPVKRLSLHTCMHTLSNKKPDCLKARSGQYLLPISAENMRAIQQQGIIGKEMLRADLFATV